MRIKPILVTVLLLLILIGLAMIPWIDGMIFKRDYYNFVKALETDKRIRIKILEYREGWFNSDAKVSIAPNMDVVGMPTPPNLPEGNKYTTPTIILTQHISHGPLVQDPISNQRKLGLASIQSNVHLPAAIEAILLGNQANSTGVVTVNGLATLGGDYLNQIKTPVFNINIPNVGMVIWQGLNGSMLFHVEGQHIQSVTSDMNIGAVTARNASGSFISKEVSTKYDITRDVTGLWNGSYTINTPEVTVSDTGTVLFSINNLGFANTFGVVGQDLYTTKLRIQLGQLKIPEFSMNQSNLDLSIENLSAPALLNLINAARKYDESATTTPEQMRQYTALITSLITPTTLLSNNVSINTSFGRLLTNGRTSWSLPVKTTDDIMKNVKSTEDVRISVSLANQLIEIIAAQETQSSHQTVDASANEPTEQNFLKQLDNLGTQNKIDLSVAIQIKDLVQTHLSPADFSKYIDQLVKVKQLTPDIATQLKMQYTAVSEHKALPPAPPPPKPASPAEVMRGQVAALIKQGYLKQDKEDYVTLITFEKGVLKANGLVVQEIK